MASHSVIVSMSIKSALGLARELVMNQPFLQNLTSCRASFTHMGKERVTPHPFKNTCHKSPRHPFSLLSLSPYDSHRSPVTSRLRLHYRRRILCFAATTMSGMRHREEGDIHHDRGRARASSPARRPST
jgi:hypothetical protein